MHATINHATYGTITYEESFWTGKKLIYINGKPLDKIDKKTFMYSKDFKNTMFKLKGNFLTGVKLCSNTEEITLIIPAKWYEMALSIFIVAFTLAWGNIPSAVAIFPIVGGAIGGGVGGIMMVLNMYLMRLVKKWWLKIIIWLCVFATTLLILFILAIALVSILLV